METKKNSGKTDDLKEGIKALKYLIVEWERIVVRPYKDITLLEKDLRLALTLKHLEDVDIWLRERM